jgi:hypothetical protein
VWPPRGSEVTASFQWHDRRFHSRLCERCVAHKSLPSAADRAPGLLPLDGRLAVLGVAAGATGPPTGRRPWVAHAQIRRVLRSVYHLHSISRQPRPGVLIGATMCAVSSGFGGFDCEIQGDDKFMGNASHHGSDVPEHSCEQLAQCDDSGRRGIPHSWPHCSATWANPAAPQAPAAAQQILGSPGMSVGGRTGMRCRATSSGGRCCVRLS